MVKPVGSRATLAAYPTIDRLMDSSPSAAFIDDKLDSAYEVILPVPDDTGTAVRITGLCSAGKVDVPAVIVALLV